MVPYFGDFLEDETVYIPFNTFTSDDPSASCTITDLADADIKVHKDGSTTEIATDGATIAINFDSITGNHLITIDTSAHSDYATGSDYMVRIEGTTVDGATINAWVGLFSIENRFKEVTVTSMGAGVVTAAAIADAAIDNATFAADVGSTAYATNIIALAIRKALDEINLDHLMKIAVADRDVMAEVVDGTVLANIMTKTDGDTSDFDPDTDSLEAIRDHIGDGTNLTEAGGDGDHLVEAGGDGDHLTEVTVAALDNNVITAASINGDAITEAKIADNAIAAEHLNATACTKIIDDFETQSQADPTGFHVNVMEINSLAVAAKLALSIGTMVTGTVSWDNTNASTTVIYSDDITEATADHYKGRLIAFTSGDLVGQYTDITAYALDTGEGKFTVTALTEAPADNVTFIIV